MATAYTPEVAELPRSPRAFDTVTGMREQTYSAVKVLLFTNGLQYQAPTSVPEFGPWRPNEVGYPEGITLRGRLISQQLEHRFGWPEASSVRVSVLLGQLEHLRWLMRSSPLLRKQTESK
jgi:hypothetical protein